MRLESRFVRTRADLLFARPNLLFKYCTCLLFEMSHVPLLLKPNSKTGIKITVGSVFSPLLTKVSGFSLANVLICVYINLLANENRLKNNQNVPSGPRIVSYLTRVRANTALSKLRGFWNWLCEPSLGEHIKCNRRLLPCYSYMVVQWGPRTRRNRSTQVINSKSAAIRGVFSPCNVDTRCSLEYWIRPRALEWVQTPISSPVPPNDWARLSSLDMEWAFPKSESVSRLGPP